MIFSASTVFGKGLLSQKEIKKLPSTYKINEFKIKIRKATPEDSREMASLYFKVYNTTLKSMVTKEYLYRMDYNARKAKIYNRVKNKEWIFLVAEVKGKIVGMIGLTDNDTPPSSYKYQIRSLYVDPDNQRMGIGSILFKKIIKILKSSNCDKVILWTLEANKFTRNFFEKNGGKIIQVPDFPKKFAKGLSYVAYAWDFTKK